MSKVKSNIVIEGARIVFRNFSGTEGRFNPVGRRNFCVLLDSDLAQTLYDDGWNIRWLEPKDDQADRQAYLQVTVRYESDISKQRFNPKIVLVSHKGKNVLDESTINILDWAEIINTDLVIRPYNWEVNEKGGVKAYIKSMYVTIAEDEFESKYRDVPDSTTESLGGCGNCEECTGQCHEH